MKFVNFLIVRVVEIVADVAEGLVDAVIVSVEGYELILSLGRCRRSPPHLPSLFSEIRPEDAAVQGVRSINAPPTPLLRLLSLSLRSFLFSLMVKKRRLLSPYRTRDVIVVSF